MEERYVSRYPRHGQIAVLCEGDLAGYEADLLEKWLSGGGVHVDVWPCGTKSAMYGMSDAIGRAIDVFVIEDRDYRRVEEAARECDDKRKDRVRRAVRLAEWRTWRRNEIENYLIEPEVAFPVLGEVFDVKAEALGERFDQLLDTVHVDQCAQWTLAEFLAELPERSRYVGGLPRKGGRPKWNEKSARIEAPTRQAVEDLLEEKLRKLAGGFGDKLKKLDVTNLLERFRGKCDEWRGQNRNTPVWRVEWAGKELFTLLCRWLSGEFGWPVGVNYERQPVNWEELVDKRQDGEMDREIANTLQPRFVEAFLDFLGGGKDENPLVAEWKEIREAIASAVRPVKGGCS